MTGIFIPETLHSVSWMVWRFLRETQSAWVSAQRLWIHLWAQSNLWDLQMHSENVYYQYNANHNYHAGICALQDKRLEESPCSDWMAKARS